ncbi:MAG: hypothetical protein MHPSP_002214, partial [Paramarteilia canceri]
MRKLNSFDIQKAENIPSSFRGISCIFGQKNKKYVTESIDSENRICKWMCQQQIQLKKDYDIEFKLIDHNKKAICYSALKLHSIHEDDTTVKELKCYNKKYLSSSNTKELHKSPITLYVIAFGDINFFDLNQKTNSFTLRAVKSTKSMDDLGSLNSNFQVDNIKSTVNSI